MWRLCFALLLVLGSAAAISATAGCAEKTTTVQQKETRTESEPEMVSPGDEVVE